MKRREFLREIFMGVTALGLGAAGRLAWGAEEAKKEVALRLGSQESRIPGKSLAEKVRKLESWGGSGLEVGGAPAFGYRDHALWSLASREVGYVAPSDMLFGGSSVLSTGALGHADLPRAEGVMFLPVIRG